MKRIALLAGVCLALGLAPAHGVVEAGLTRTVNVWLDGFTTNGMLSLYASARTGMTLTDADTDPIDDVQISAFRSRCDPNCTFDSWSATDGVVDMDLLGNVARVTGCLAPQSGPCQQFDLSFRRPSFTNPMACSTFACLNTWVDPEDPAADATAFTSVYRAGYQGISGVWADSAFDGDDHPFVSGTSTQLISARAHVEP